ncbi:MAG: hypothetical protein CL912_08620 [Deltaproteobacteria bacterium]|nr:hypothetical protein [Deltaproteobacteria bacterium]
MILAFDPFPVVFGVLVTFREAVIKFRIVRKSSLSDCGNVFEVALVSLAKSKLAIWLRSMLALTSCGLVLYLRGLTSHCEAGS